VPSGSGKSTAIVPASWTKTGFTALFVEESPEVNFNDRLIIIVRQAETLVPIDPHLIEVCAKDSIECLCQSDEAVCVGAIVVDGHVRLRVPAASTENPIRVVIRLLGIRRGFADLRFPDRTREQFESNERFLQSAYTM
jgi:hypothetical protein